MCVPILRSIGTQLTKFNRKYAKIVYFWSHALGIVHWNLYKNPSSMNGWYATVNVLKKRPMLYNGVFGCHGNTCYVILIGTILYMLYSIGPINVCADFEINWYKIYEVRKYAKSCFIWRHVTQKGYIVRHGDREHFETNQKSLRHPVKNYGSNSGFRVFGDLDLDLWPMFYCLSHVLRMMYWNIHAKFP